MGSIISQTDLVQDSCCAKIQFTVDALNSAANAMQPTGTFAALTSDANAGTYQLITLDGNKDRPTEGSFRKVYTKDVVPNCDTDTDADSVCATPTFSADDVASNYATVEHNVDLSIKREIVLDLEDFQKFCVSPTEYLADRLRAMRSGVLQELNQKLSGRVVDYVGLYANQTAPANSILNPISVSFLSQSGAGGYVFDPVGYGKILDEYAKLGWAYTSPIIVGGSHVNTLLGIQGFYTGVNSNGVQGAGLPNLFADYTIDQHLPDGDNHLLTWKPGSIGVATVNEISDAMIAYSVPNQKERAKTISPFGDGFTWDFFFDKDESGCKVKFKWQLWFDAIMPVPYDGTCAKKPVLNFIVGCNDNECPDSSVTASGGEGI